MKILISLIIAIGLIYPAYVEAAPKCNKNKSSQDCKKPKIHKKFQGTKVPTPNKKR